ncbi:hypothetical protein [Arthrobacter bambusae]|uniref:Uncharacterized protein n=1 Tax=Arthrobacter bambusae TaxID=1338426 RepID=A0AAW8D8G6_9MICC|nr:hypothetical protein [Arthrobacter bambusae]MDP9904552.1 hypothetical protein [Arthrobacter bambusae]MDQ0129367.1 hypothetical protein [Arthrobacter bambusae]MDQ0181020.1 hypothetical protein [Arthrobacter bambusae]
MPAQQPPSSSPSPSSPASARDVVHHLYANAGDLLPYCGVIPGPDAVTGDWHTGHDRDTLLETVHFGLPGCVTCLSPAALGGFTPLIMDDDEEVITFERDVPVWGDDEPEVG